jgi:hypothetical protein
MYAGGRGRSIRSGARIAVLALAHGRRGRVIGPVVEGVQRAWRRDANRPVDARS